MYLFHFKKHGNEWKVLLTKHTDEVRDGNFKSRRYNYTDEKIHDILNLAIGSMTQYRKDYISITFLNEYGKTNAMLCKLEDSTITIITMLEGVNKQINDVFRNAKHIYLRNYIFKRPDKFDREINLKIVKPKPKIRMKIRKRPTKSDDKTIISKHEIDEFIKSTNGIRKLSSI